MTFTLIPNPNRLDGVLARNLGERWPVEKVVARFGKSPSAFQNGHDWFFQSKSGEIYSLSCRGSAFVIGAASGFLPEDIHTFLDWISDQLTMQEPTFPC